MYYAIGCRSGLNDSEGHKVTCGITPHSSLSAVILIAQSVPNLCVRRTVLLKHQVNWKTVCGAIHDLPRRNIWFADNRADVLNVHLSMLVGHYVPTKVILVRYKDNPWFDDQCRHAFDLKQDSHLRWTRDRSRARGEGFVHCQVRAKETYSESKRQFSDRNRVVLMNSQTPHKWWSTLMSAGFVIAPACWWDTDLLDKTRRRMASERQINRLPGLLVVKMISLTNAFPTFCYAYYVVLLCSVVLGCRYTSLTTLPCSQWCSVSNWGCA